MLSNLSAQPMETTLLGRPGRVHEGMLSAATYVHCNTGAALADAARRFPGWPLLVTGHSMGGAHTGCITLLSYAQTRIGGKATRGFLLPWSAQMAKQGSQAFESCVTAMVYTLKHRNTHII